MKLFAAVTAAVLAALLPAQAQDWPPRSVRIVVPSGAGSTPDVVARLVAEQLRQKYPNSAFAIENRPGANGNAGIDAVAKAAPDGTTLGVSIGGPLAINALISKLPYDPARDIAPVTQLVTMPSALAVHPDLGVNSVAELIALLKKEPGKYSFGSIGNGSLSHLTMEAVAIKGGARIAHVPYPSAAAAMTALIRGDIHMAALPAIAVMPHADLGKAKIVAVAPSVRSPFLANIPTLKEAGLDVQADTWIGMIAPGGTPAALLDAIRKEVMQAIADRSARDTLATQYMEPVGSTPAELRAMIEAERARWEPIIAAAAVRMN